MFITCTHIYEWACFLTSCVWLILCVQVTIWEALTNSKPGTHPLPCDPSRVERSDLQCVLL